jgi:hypothetical protein
MKITKTQLKQIIKEEIEAVLNEVDPMARIYGKQQPQAPAAPSADCADVVEQERKHHLEARHREITYGDDGGEYGKAEALRKAHPKCFKD